MNFLPSAFVVAFFFCAFGEFTSLSSALVSDKESDQRLGPQRNGCECIKYDCGCCERVNLALVKGIVCTNITYLEDDYGISVTLTYNNYTLYNETLSARNPPPMCVGIPELEEVSAEFCLKFYDLTFEHKHFHGCLKVIVAVYHIIHKAVTVGCIDLPKNHYHSISDVPSLFNDNIIESIYRFKKNWGEKNEMYPSVTMI